MPTRRQANILTNGGYFSGACTYIYTYIYIFKMAAASSALHAWQYEWSISICLKSGNMKPLVAKWPCCFKDIFIYIYIYTHTHTHIHTHTYHSASMRLKSNFKHALKVESRSRRPPSIHRLHPRMSIVDSLVWCQRIQGNHRDHPHPSACVVCKTIIFTKSFRNQQVAVISIHERVTWNIFTTS